MASIWKRGKTYYARYYVGGHQKAICLGTSSYPIAKEKLRQLESKLAMGFEIPVQTKTPLVEVVGAYVTQIRSTKTRNSIKSELYYLRDMFGPICAELEPVSPEKTSKRRGRHFDAQFIEEIKTPDIVAFLTSRMQTRGLAPKTGNHYRGILSRLFSWAMTQYGVKMPNDVNPAAKVERYRERSRTIRFLTLAQINEQLETLAPDPLVQTMVAVYIYAGLRREEAIWLTHKDVNLRAGKYGVIYVQAKTVDGEFWEPKTKVNRVVPISRTLRGYLDNYEAKIVPGGWYFPSRKGRRWDPDNFSADLRELNRKAGLAWGCLDFRHTFGSHLAMKGESLYKIATIMGNSPEICRRHYAALMPESLLDSVEFGAPDPCQETQSSRPKPIIRLLPKTRARNE